MNAQENLDEIQEELDELLISNTARNNYKHTYEQIKKRKCKTFNKKINVLN